MDSVPIGTAQRLLRRRGLLGAAGHRRGHRRRDALWEHRRGAGARTPACARPGRRRSRASDGRDARHVRGVSAAQPGTPSRARSRADVAHGAARRHRHRAAPRRGGAARQRGEVSRPVRERDRGRVPDVARRPDSRRSIRRSCKMLGYERGRGAATRCRHASAVLVPERPRDLRAPLESDGEVRNAEYRAAPHATAACSWSSRTRRVVRDEQGRITGYEGTITDITRAQARRNGRVRRKRSARRSRCSRSATRSSRPTPTAASTT